MSRYRVTRTVDCTECPWLEDDLHEGIYLYRCHKVTYGCIGPDGEPMTHDPEGGYPFFEVPRDALEAIDG